jgi:hypothetical protein
VSNILDGGLPRLRKDNVGKVAPIIVQWTLNPIEYSYMQAFYRLIEYGAQPFSATLLMDGAQLDTYTVSIEPGSWRLASTEGLSYVVAATLNVLPLAVDPTYDQSLVDTFNTYGADAPESLALLADLSTHLLP